MIKLNKMVKMDKKEFNMKYIRFTQPTWTICQQPFCVLKELTSSNYFNVLGTKFHIHGPKFYKLSEP